ncbi:MAG: hypothetical protein ABR564_01890 [Candidatus Dormibacteria bacterium]
MEVAGGRGVEGSVDARPAPGNSGRHGERLAGPVDGKPPERTAGGREGVEEVAANRVPGWLRVAWLGAAVVVVAVAAALRLIDLNGQPGGLYPDEAAEGLDAHRLLHEAGFHPVFFHDDAGREALFGYLVAATFRVAGESATVLRGVAAVVGVVGVVALWPALRRFGAGAAVAGMAWAAGSLWLICVARDGFRVILVPLVGALALASLIRWGDRPGRARATVAGIVAGAGLWTYQPLKLLPLLVILWLWWIRHVDRERFTSLRPDLRWFAIAFAVVSAPMAVAAIGDPGNYLGRGASVTAFNPDQGPGALPLHVLRTIGMLGFTGDPNPRHNVGGLPLVGVPLALLVVAGGIRAWKRRGDHAHSLVLLGSAVFLIPPLIATEGGAPHFLRSLGLAPYLAALVALGCAELVDRCMAAGLRGGRAAAVAIAPAAALLVAAGVAAAQAYFSRGVADRYDAYSFDLVALSAQADHGPSTAVIVDDFAAFDVRFLDAADPPTIVDPAAHLDRPERFARIVARDRRQLTHVVGPSLAGRSVVAARDHAGRPVVWAVAP